MNRTRPPIEASLHLSSIRTGAFADYKALAPFHYRANRPATATRILTLRHDQPSVVGRYLQRHGESRVVAVLIESLPPIACRLRDLALDGRYRLKGPRRMAVINAELRCISRVVVHPQWRGLGLAVRLVRHALATATTPLTEALAAMGHVHPFFEMAGMTAYRRPPHAFDARLADALRSAGFDLLQLASPATVAAHIAASPLTLLLQREIDRWWRTVHRGDVMPDLTHALTVARRRLLSEPIYYLHANARTYTGTEVPEPRTE